VSDIVKSNSLVSSNRPVYILVSGSQGANDLQSVTLPNREENQSSMLQQLIIFFVLSGITLTLSADDKTSRAKDNPTLPTCDGHYAEPLLARALPTRKCGPPLERKCTLDRSDDIMFSNCRFQNVNCLRCFARLSGSRWKPRGNVSELFHKVLFDS
jgi:hypothetical protein